MSEYDALLRTVCENPDDDLPRLVLADWLEENGDPDRAEFIRVQCQLPELPPRTQLTRRSSELLNLWGSKWRDELPSDPTYRWGTFSRGFITSISVMGDQPFVRDMDDIFSATPITSVEIYDPNAFVDFASSPYLSRIRKLWVNHNANVIRKLKSLGPLPHIWELSVYRDPEYDSELAELQIQFGARFTIWNE